MPMKKSFFMTLILPSFFIFSSFAIAAAPDAGQILTEQRQLEQKHLEQFPSEYEKGMEGPALVDTGVKVPVKNFKFSGDTDVASDAELQKLVKDSVGKELGFAELQMLAERVQTYLRERGYLLARVYLPQQDVTSGAIEFVIVAGRVEGKIKVDVQSPRRIQEPVLEKMANQPVPEGGAIRLKSIERAVLLMNDLPGLSARAFLDRGDKAGTSRVTIKAKEGPLVSGLVSVDNYSGRYTGTWRRIAQVALNDPFGQGDRVDIALINAEDLLYQGRIGYTASLASNGTVGNIAFSRLNYEIGDDLASLRSQGTAQTILGGVSHPLVRTRKASLWAGTGFEYFGLEDKSNDLVTSHRNLPVGNINFNGNFFDGFGKGGFTNIALFFYNGRVNMSNGKSDDAAGPHNVGDFFRSTYSIARLQRVTKNVSFFGSARGQYSDSNLDSSQKFILGGPTGVRAYPVGEASGDQGHAITFETRLDIPHLSAWTRTQLVGFFDAGYIQLHKSTWANAVTNASGQNRYWLKGAGPGISVEKDETYSVRFSYAFKVGDNPGRNSTDNDADNHNDKGRFWLQTVIWF